MSDDTAAVDDGCLVEEELLSKAAFDFLSSSTTDRYVRLAIEAGDRFVVDPSARRNLATAPVLEPASTRILLRARRLWDRVGAATKRDVCEVELAILLPAVSGMGTPGADDLVAAISRCQTLPGSPKNWPIRLAQALWRDRRKVISEAATAKIKAILNDLPEDEARQEVLQSVMENRCPRCFDYNPNGGQFWCCYESRGG